MRHIYSFFIFAFVLSGCTSDSTLAPIQSVEKSFWELRLNYRAVQLSLNPPHNTVQLLATPYMANGEIWTPSTTSSSGADSLLAESPTEFVSRDSTKVVVSSDGLVTARALQSGTVFVVARRTLDGVIQTDSALVRVSNIPSPPVLKTFILGAGTNDSAKIAVGWGGTTSVLNLSFTVRDTSEMPISGLPVYVTSLDPSVAFIAQRDIWAATKRVTAFQPGVARIQAETWVYGVSKVDTLLFTVGWPLKFLNIDKPLTVCSAPGSHPFIDQLTKLITVGPGAVIRWTNSTGKLFGECASETTVSDIKTIDILFNDPDNVLPSSVVSQNSGGGDILSLSGDTTLSYEERSRFRRFLKPGTYIYRIEPLGISGTIIVKDF